jgi:lysophospholipase L1-like esterase
MKKHITLSLITALLTVSLIFIIGEIMVRTLIGYSDEDSIWVVPSTTKSIDPYKTNPFILKFSPFLYSHIPHSTYNQERSYYSVKYSINEFGFRDFDTVFGKNLNGVKRRLLIIGDSFTEGHGVEFSETFSNLINNELSDNWEVINVGVQGASPAYYALNIDRYMAFQPDAVLIVLYDNDIQNDRDREMQYFNLPKISYQDKKRLTHDIPVSYFIDWIISKFDKLQPVVEIILSNLSQHKVIQEKFVGKDAFKSDLVTSKVFSDHWSLSQKYLDYLVNRFSESNVQSLVMNFSMHNLPSPSRDQLMHTQLFDDYISDWAVTNKIPHLSLTELLRKKIEKEHKDVYMIIDDGHATIKSHEVIAERAIPWLKEHIPFIAYETRFGL